jgi:hypothetical protein
MPFGRLLWLALALVLGGSSLYAMHGDGGLSFFATAKPPAGDWVTVDLGACASTDRRFTFGEDIMLRDSKQRAVFASKATYGPLREGRQRIVFVMTARDGTPIRTRIDYAVTAETLKPEAVNVNGIEASTPFPEAVRRSFTFMRCSV